MMQQEQPRRPSTAAEYRTEADRPAQPASEPKRDARESKAAVELVELFAGSFLNMG